jgi:predicted ATPase/DNA-binding SARP family transcriptional activator
MLEVRLLGKFDVRLDGRPIAIPSRPAQSLLAYLLLNPRIAHRREKLAGLLWPNATEENARRNLRQALWRARQALGTDSRYLSTDDIHVAFNTDAGYRLDAALLERTGEPQGADELAGVLSECQGELLPGFYDEWVVLERQRLQALFEHKMRLLVELLVREERWPDVLAWGERWIALGQSPEPAYRALMVAYSALGDMSGLAAAFERCVAALRDDLGVEPSEQTKALYDQLSKGEPPPGISPGRAASLSHLAQTRGSNLPVRLTSFVGREREIEEVKRLISATRLLTLTGAGGSGKTRLAIRAATDLVDDFADGAWWVELAALADPALVPRAVANALGVREIPNQPMNRTLVEDLHTRHMLLVLDNCEHLVNACAQLAEELLGACPQLRILATSREALYIPGETAWPIPPLRLPDRRALPPLAALKDYEGIQLFVERAVAVKPGFALTEQNAPAVVQICRRLDGIPLGIELAAARVKVLSAEEIAARLDDRFNLLTAGSRTALPRYRTLRGAIDWSYDLLTEPERELLRRLSVFAGGFTLGAAEAVAAGEETGLDLLTHLVDKSLLVAEEAQGESRYRLLETIRQYAHERLVEAKEVGAARDRHLEFYVEFAEEAEPKWFTEAQIVWFNRVHAEYGNLSAAIEWALESGQPSAALRLTGALTWFWFHHGYAGEGLDRLQAALSQPGAAAHTAGRAKALYGAGYLQWTRGNTAEARALLEEALAIGRELGDPLTIAWSLHYSGALAYSQGAYEAGRSLIEELLTLKDVLGSAWRPFSTWLPIWLGDGAVYQGDYERARSLYRESAELLRKTGEKDFLAFALRRLGQLALYQGDAGRAAELCRESLALNAEVGNRIGIAASVAALAGVAIAQGQTVAPRPREEHMRYAAVLFGAIEALLEKIRTLLWPIDMADYNRNLAAVRAQLDEALFIAARDEGLAMTLEQGVAYALDVPYLDAGPEGGAYMTAR